MYGRAAGRFDILLILVIAELVLAPFERTSIRPVLVAVLASVLIFALWTSGAPSLLLISGAALVVIAVLAASVAQAGGGRVPRAVFTGISMTLCVVSIGSIVESLRSRLKLTGRTLAASLAIYLLIGLFFAYLYGFVAVVRSGGFFGQPGPHDPTTFVYFSFITLTSTGFGDLTPTGDLGRMLTVGEALIGQLYLVTVVAIVVGQRASGGRTS